MYINVDNVLLHDRVQYISSMSAFYLHDKKKDKYLNVDFPSQKYMCIKQCADIFKALSTSVCISLLNKIEIEAIIFFAVYFQCSFIFENIYDILYPDLMKLPGAIKTANIILGYHDEFTQDIMVFTCNHLDMRFTIEVIELMKPKKNQYKLFVEPTEYVTSRLGKKIRDVERRKIYIFCSSYMMCMMCETLLVQRKKQNDAVPMSCCNKLVHMKCLFDFWEKTTRTGKKRCVYCHMVWHHGKLQCEEAYLKWCRKKVNETRNSNHLC